MTLLAWTIVALVSVPVSASAAPQCEGPDVDPWMADFRRRVEAYDALHRLAVERFGPPLSCEGQVGSEFDGVLFGSLLFTFEGGATYSVETMPIETSISILRHPTGFEDPGAMRDVLAAYTQDIGLHIDWSAPEVTEAEGEVVRTFWDPEAGLNASASLIYVGEALVGVRVSMAL